MGTLLHHRMPLLRADSSEKRKRELWKSCRLPGLSRRFPDGRFGPMPKIKTIPTLAAVAGMLSIAALLASLIPARRAASVNPVESVRAE